MGLGGCPKTEVAWPESADLGVAITRRAEEHAEKEGAGLARDASTWGFVTGYQAYWTFLSTRLDAPRALDSRRL